MSSIEQLVIVGTGFEDNAIQVAGVWYVKFGMPTRFIADWEGGRSPYRVEVNSWNQLNQRIIPRIVDSVTVPTDYTVELPPLSFIGTGRMVFTVNSSQYLTRVSKTTLFTVRDPSDPIFGGGDGGGGGGSMLFDALSLTASPLSVEQGQTVQTVVQATLNGSPVAVGGISLDISHDGIPVQTDAVTGTQGSVTVNLATTGWQIGDNRIFYFVDTDPPGALTRVSNVVTITVTQPGGGGGSGGGGGGGGGIPPIDWSQIGIIGLPLFMGALWIVWPDKEKRRRRYDKLKAVVSGTVRASKRELDKAARMLIREVNRKR